MRNGRAGFTWADTAQAPTADAAISAGWFGLESTGTAVVQALFLEPSQVRKLARVSL